MSRWWSCAVAGFLAVTAPSVAHAQTFELFGPDGSRSRHESTQNFLVELRGGEQGARARGKVVGAG